MCWFVFWDVSKPSEILFIWDKMWWIIYWPVLAHENKKQKRTTSQHIINQRGYGKSAFLIGTLWLFDIAIGNGPIKNDM